MPRPSTPGAAPGPAPGRSPTEPAEPTAPTAPTGDVRPPTRQAIALAAATLFRRHGFSATTIRGVAVEAGVNPALVIRHFGSKEALFLEVLAPVGSSGAGEDGAPSPGPSAGLLAVALEGPVQQLGRRLVRYVVDEVGVADSQVRDIYLALQRAADIPEVRERLREVVRHELVKPLAQRIDGPRAQVRAGLVAVQLTGLMAAVWGGEDRLVDEMGRDEIIDLYGGALQHVIDTAGRG